MFEQTSLFSEKSSAPLEKLLSVIDDGAENNTWILLSGGSSAGNAIYRPGDEFENSNNAIVDLIHWGWFDNRTVFVTYKRELSREKGFQDRSMEGLNPEYKNRFAFYSVFKVWGPAGPVPVPIFYQKPLLSSMRKPLYSV